MRCYRSVHRAVCLFAAVCLTALVAGCPSGPPTGQVKGKVTFQGKAVLRLSVVGWNTTAEDIDRSADAIVRASQLARV